MHEYMRTDDVAEMLGCSTRVARGIMQAAGLTQVAGGVIRRDVLERYLETKTVKTAYSDPQTIAAERPAKRYPRYAKTGGA